MKKILLTVALAGVVASAFGQGQVQFRNVYSSSTPPINARVTLDSLAGVRLEGTGYRAALVGAAATGAVDWTLEAQGNLALLFSPDNAAVSWVTFRTGTAAGVVDTGTLISRTVAGANWATDARVQMVAWEGNYDTWQAAWDAARGGNVRIGVSNPLTVRLPSDATSPILTYLVGLNPFYIQYVPEPTTFALAGLGAAALLIFRRRN